MIRLCTVASTTWLSSPRSTSERHRGPGGQMHTHMHTNCQNDVKLCASFWGREWKDLYKHTCIADCCLYFVYSDQKAKKGKEGRDPVDMVKFSKVKQSSLLSTMLKQHPFIFILIYVYLACHLYCFPCCCTNIFFLAAWLPLQSPIQESLIDFSDSGMNRVAADIFLGERRVKEWRIDTDGW